MAESKKRILILDDEKDICEILKHRFLKFGFEVSVAYDGKEGFDKILQETTDCVILDIRIQGGEDGLTFLRRLRSFRDDDAKVQERIRKIPVIVLTATGQNMKPLFEMEGINDFMEKPFDAAHLKDRVLKILSKK